MLNVFFIIYLLEKILYSSLFNKYIIVYAVLVTKLRNYIFYLWSIYHLELVYLFGVYLINLKSLNYLYCL